MPNGCHTGDIRALAVSPDGLTLASAGADKTVRLWYIEARQELLALPPQLHAVNGLSFSSDGTRLAAAIHNGDVMIGHASRP